MSRCSLTSFPLIVMLAPLLRTASSTADEPLTIFCPPWLRNYTANSAYQTNLMDLLSSLAAADVSASGSVANSSGSVPDTVYGAVVCRGDIDDGACRRCLDDAVDVVLRQCPNKKVAVVWYDYCLLRYRDSWFFPSAGRYQYRFFRNNTTVAAADLSLFKEQVWAMMSKLINYATSNSPSGRVFATGEAAFTAAEPKVYGLVQCTTDQSYKTCEACLNDFLNWFRTFPEGWRGARVLATTCWLWYELYPFYNGTAMVSVPSPLAAPAPAPRRESVLLPLPPGAPSTSYKENTRQGGKHSSIIIVVVVVGAVLGLITTVICIGVWRTKASKKPHHIGSIPQVRSLSFDLTTLKVATNNFSNSHKLGEGGFGVVYKGILAGGQVVAVKRLSERSKQGLEELRNEVELLAKQQHRNLVTLLGACMEGENLLIYEYVPNKSLDNFLFDSTKKDQLIWQLRYKIIRGVAQGLLYLHEESQYNIVHRDLKASNILLDANMNPKISDFGISRLFPGDQTHASTSRVVGTFGYMAPEYVNNGQFSKKSDVFSFGVLVLEIVTGRTHSSFSYAEGSINLLSYVWEHWTGGAMREIIDPSLGDVYQEAEVARCIQIGLLCAQQVAADRPTMPDVVLMLNSCSMSLNVPQLPASFPGQSEIGRHATIDPSASKLTLSELDPR